MIYIILIGLVILMILICILYSILNSELIETNNRINAFHERLSTLRDQIMQRLENDINKLCG